MSDTAQAEALGSSKADRIARYFVIGGSLLVLAAPSALVAAGWLPDSATSVSLILGILNVLLNIFVGLINLVASTNLGDAALAAPPEVQLYIAGVGGFFGLVFLLAGALGGPASPREYFGGATLAALAIFAALASRDLPGMSGFKFGPGTAPRGFAIALGVLGLLIAASGVITKGPAADRFHIRGPVFVTLSVLIFAATVRSFGLAVSSFLSICAAAAATPDARILETLAWAVVLTAFCCVLFLSPYLLGLPIPLWPVSSDPMVLIRGISFQ
jgi:putative tricarboxylic transport membrane protein